VDATGAGAHGVDKVTYVDHDEHNARVCPVVRYCNELDLDGNSDGEVEPNIDLAARINQDTFDRLVVQRFQAWLVRTISGMSLTGNGSDESGEGGGYDDEASLVAAEKLRLSVE